MKTLLDLHGYKAEDVETAVDAFIYKHHQANTSRVEIMTGKGSGKVQKVVIQYLKKAGYHWKYKELPNGKPNEGVIVVFMD